MINPLGSNILTTRVVQSNVTYSGLYVSQSPNLTKQLKVVAVGLDVAHTSVGEVLVCVPGTAQLVEHEGRDYYMVSEANIMVKVT